MGGGVNVGSDDRFATSSNGSGCDDGRPRRAAAIIASFASGMPAMVAARCGERFRSGGGAVDRGARGVDGSCCFRGGNVELSLVGGGSDSRPGLCGVRASLNMFRPNCSVAVGRLAKSSSCEGVGSEGGLTASCCPDFGRATGSEEVGFTLQTGLEVEERLNGIGESARWPKPEPPGLGGGET